SRRSFYSFPLPFLVVLKFEGGTRSRSDQAHVTAEDVEELRQFIQSRRPQKAPPGNDPVIPHVQFCHRYSIAHQPLEVPFMPRSLGMHFHAPEFENHEGPASEPNPFLPVKNGTGGRNLDRCHDNEHDRQPNWI